MELSKVYHMLQATTIKLNFETLREQAVSKGLTGTFSTPLSDTFISSVTGMKIRGCIARVRFVSGVIEFCCILQNQQVLLRDMYAQQVLSQAKDLSWELLLASSLPQKQEELPSEKPLLTEITVPVKRLSLEEEPPLFERYERRVYFLLDGKRSVKRLAQLTNIDVATIISMLTSWHEQKLIDYF